MISDIFDRHEKVALSFSGGKDSLALLAMYRDYWGRLTVYWMNPGNPFPETVELMDKIKTLVPHFKEVAGRQREIVGNFGWPSDVVPIQWTESGQFLFGEKPIKIQGRLDCCWRSLMLPMMEAMRADGVTCIIRGKREDEADKSPSRSGETHEGIELVYPLWDWTAADVFAYLKANDVRLPESYAQAKHSLDCMDCTAWWGEGLSRYLKVRHPAHYDLYVARVSLIKRAIAEQMDECEV